MDTETLRPLLPHYVVLALLILLVLTGMRLAFSEVGFLVRFAVALAVGLAYPPVVRALGVAPEPWQR